MHRCPCSPQWPHVPTLPRALPLRNPDGLRGIAVCNGETTWELLVESLPEVCSQLFEYPTVVR